MVAIKAPFESADDSPPPVTVGSTEGLPFDNFAAALDCVGEGELSALKRGQ
jgi:hypothetical protein